MADKPRDFRLKPRYWDACLFIDIIQRDKPDRLLILDPLVKTARDGNLLVVTSALTIGEVLYGPEGKESSSLPDDDIKFIENLLDEPWISVRAADRLIYREAALLRRKYGLELPDAVHLATALRYKEISALETYDQKHLLKLGQRSERPLIPIRKPMGLVSHMPLFDPTPKSQGDEDDD